MRKQPNPEAGSVHRIQLLQRACACGQRTGNGECEEWRQKCERMLQRAAVNTNSINTAPPIVYDVLRSPGRPLDAATRVHGTRLRPGEEFLVTGRFFVTFNDPLPAEQVDAFAGRYGLVNLAVWLVSFLNIGL